MFVVPSSEFSNAYVFNTMTGTNNLTRKYIDFTGLLKAQEDKNVLIIDVREVTEINETGKLPGSIHIPMKNVIQQLKDWDNDDFRNHYQKLKPNVDTKIVLSCRSGVRSGKVQEELEKLGYTMVYNYIGGWNEWDSKNPTS